MNVLHSSTGAPPWCPRSSPSFLPLSHHLLLLTPSLTNQFSWMKTITLSLETSISPWMSAMFFPGIQSTNVQDQAVLQTQIQSQQCGQRSGHVSNDPTPATNMVKFCTALIRRRYVVIQLAITEAVDYLDGIQLPNLYH
jgi:hypothetical protein